LGDLRGHGLGAILIYDINAILIFSSYLLFPHLSPLDCCCPEKGARELIYLLLGDRKEREEDERSVRVKKDLLMEFINGTMLLSKKKTR
jgi:hypothetical protein